MFCFNFHPSKSYTDYKVGMDLSGEFRIVLDSDWSEFGGHNRRDRAATCHTEKEDHVGKRCHMKTYLPCRTAVVFERVGSSALMEDLIVEEKQTNHDTNHATIPSSKPSSELSRTNHQHVTVPNLEIQAEIPAHFL